MQERTKRYGNRAINSGSFGRLQAGSPMTPLVASITLPLFVPADRPDRFDKALAAGADAVILDLEDAVAPGAKEAARSALAGAYASLAAAACPAIVRVNAEDTPFHAADLAACTALPLRAVMVPKVEDADTVARVAGATGLPVLALIESARGLAAARAVAASGARLVFGSIDFAADLGCAHTREALLLARLELVLASRLAGGPAPLDGVTAGIRDTELVRDDAAYGISLGFAGKLLIHPAQIAPAAAGLQPDPDQLAWARRVLAAGRDGGAATVDGAMVDAPVRLRAEQIERRARPRG